MITLVNEYSTVLDACVVLPISLCDLLLRLAEDPALYSPKWSADILSEVEGKLKSSPFNVSSEKARYRLACMQSAFPEAMVSGYQHLIPAMTNHEKDRHVLAAAVRAKADAIITCNVKDFPPECLEPHGIELMTPDQFLLHQWHLDEQLVRNRVEEQAGGCQKPLDAHLALLSKMVPQFASLMTRS